MTPLRKCPERLTEGRPVFARDRRPLGGGTVTAYRPHPYLEQRNVLERERRWLHDTANVPDTMRHDSPMASCRKVAAGRRWRWR